MNITYVEKDKVLNCLCSGELLPEVYCNLNRTTFLKNTGLNTQTANSILTYFSRIGLVSKVNYKHQAPDFYLIVHMEAFDLHNHGGFYIQEELILKNMQILSLEIEKLKSNFPEKIEAFAHITTILGTILAAASKFIGD